MSHSRFQLNKLLNNACVRVHLAKSWKIFILLAFLLSPFGGSISRVKAASAITFTAEELLGKPTDSSITINIVPAATIEYHYQYGTSPGSYTSQTPNVTAAANQPHEVVISGLNANKKYYYRMRYHAPGDGMEDWVVRGEHSFRTQRARGSSFVFTITADSHAGWNTQHQQAMTNILNDQPDFHLDLGDTFMLDNVTSQSQVNNAYLAHRDPLYMDRIGHSVSIFLVVGNHENEEGWNFDDSPFSIALASVQARKAYYPTPITDGFYSGNDDPLEAIDETTYGDEFREDYYAWEWGDALFVVLDPYHYTMQIPYSPAGGESNDEGTPTDDRWTWTLGKQQYNWLKQTLENSNAQYKFIFAHHMVGGMHTYARGGAGSAHMFEWGGYNADGSTWGFDSRRPGWGADPIHQLMVDNNVSAFFHGHDHQYVYETRDGIVYQEVPSPSLTGYGFGGVYTEGDYGDYQTIEILPNSGHLRVMVTPEEATVDYVRSDITAVSYTYTIVAQPSGPSHNLTLAVEPAGGGTTNPSVGLHSYAEGAVVNVTATPAGGYAFDHWSGDCTGSGTCQVTMSADRSVTAHFTAIIHDLTVAVDPVGGGTTNPAVGVRSYTEGTVVRITATPAAGYAFDHWSGDCTGSGICQVTMSADKSVTAHFVITHKLTVAVDPVGGGTTNPTVGVRTYKEGAVVSITTIPATGYVFDHWSGDCTGSGTCQVTIDADKSVTAHFAVITHDLSVAVEPAGGGTTNPAVGVHSYAEGTVVNVTAAPAAGYLFDHWSGACTGSGTCQVTMDADKSVTAHFAVITHDLSVAVEPVGGGTANPAVGVHSYAEGTVVRVTAAPAAGYLFDHWSGDCTGSGTCQVTMDADKSVTAYFTKLLPTCHALRISHSGHGRDPVASPTNSTGCSLSRYIEGETINLSDAIPDSGWQVSAWTGTQHDASVASTNGVTMPAGDHAVSVIYRVNLYIPMVLGDG